MIIPFVQSSLIPPDFRIFHLGRLRGGRQRGPVRGCRPSEAPSALPPDDPAGFVVYPHSHGLALRGFPYSTIHRGLRGIGSGSFLAALGDLPARREMPAHAFALNVGRRGRLVDCQASRCG